MIGRTNFSRRVRQSQEISSYRRRISISHNLSNLSNLNNLSNLSNLNNLNNLSYLSNLSNLNNLSNQNNLQMSPRPTQNSH